MLDLLSLLKTAVIDPLAGLLFLVAVGAPAVHLFFRRRPLARAIARVVFLVLLTAGLLHAGIVPYRPLQSTGGPVRDTIYGLLKIAWWLGAAWFMVGLLRAFVTVELPREYKLLQDLVAGLVYISALFAIIAYVFDLPIEGLLATSGAIAIILGLALQSTLGDVFSGLVLNFSRPYQPGDWINLEGGTSGSVIEMNWRATHILTDLQDLAIIPNSAIAKAKIVNASSPSRLHGVAITVQLGAGTPPALGSEILDRALLTNDLIMRQPPPNVVVKSIMTAYVEFRVTFFVADLGATSEAQNELFDLIFRHATAAGLALAPPAHEAAELQTPAKAKPERERLLDLVPTFASLTDSERAELTAKLKRHAYHEGEAVFEPGAVFQSLFIVASGVLSIVRRDVETDSRRLGPGDHFGEISLLTGAACTARISALTFATVYELAKKDLAPVLEARPEVCHELGLALARRQAEGRSTAAVETDHPVPTNGLASWFSERIEQLYSLASAD
jgi:small-conductance mechanosensitive channel